LESLPAQDWTLLIQDIEKHLPDFRAYFQLTAFVPDWRVDDLMVSFAAPGGSVGAHLDNYDVFLCQGSGSRQWKLAEPGTVAADPDSEELSLLKPFRDESPILAEGGDILYLPPGVPHWGVAQTACVTYSIGMRAPTRTELLAQLDPLTAASAPPGIDVTDVFYRDPDLAASEAIPGLITTRAIERIRNILGSGHDATDAQLLDALGRIVTEPKPWLRPTITDSETISARLADLDSKAELRVHGMARIAYFESGETCSVFANGFHHAFSSDMLIFIKDLCQSRTILPQTLRNEATSNDIQELLLWLGQQGIFDL